LKAEFVSLTTQTTTTYVRVSCDSRAGDIGRTVHHTVKTQMINSRDVRR